MLIQASQEFKLIQIQEVKNTYKIFLLHISHTKKIIFYSDNRKLHCINHIYLETLQISKIYIYVALLNIVAIVIVMHKNSFKRYSQNPCNVFFSPPKKGIKDCLVKSLHSVLLENMSFEFNKQKNNKCRKYFCHRRILVRLCGVTVCYSLQIIITTDSTMVTICTTYFNFQ